jgi:fructose-specific phosphotransferase system IIA component
MDLFGINHIYLDLEVNSKAELFEFIAAELKKLGRITESKDFKVAMEKRESEISTGLGDGLAIPHALHTSVLFPTILYIRLKNQLDYNAIDQKPVKEVYAIAMPNSYQKEHLTVLSQIAKIYLDEPTKTKLQGYKTAKSIYELVTKTVK